jgi:hypothetical protein
MRDNEKLNIDALLRDVARQQNAALKLDDIKQDLLKKVREGEYPDALEPADELSARRDKKARIRRMTIGFASAAAALLLLLSARNMLSRSNMTDQATPQERYAASAPEAAKNSAAAEQADIFSLPAPAAMPESPAAMPAATEAPAAIEPQLGTMQAPEDAAGGAASQDRADNGTRNLYGIAADDASASAIEAVRAALTAAGRNAEAEAIYADALLVENAEFTLRTLSGDPAEVQSMALYVVSLGADEETAKKYAVDAATFEVYGEIV